MRTHKTSCMLQTHRRYAVVAPDWPPPFPYALAHNTDCARSVVEAMFAGLDERVAWEMLFTNDQRLEQHRLRYGNRGKRRARKRPQLALFGATA